MLPNALDQGRVWTDIKIDLVEIWIEVLPEKEILSRCQKLNPLLNVEVLDCQSLIANVLSNISEYVIEATVNEIRLRIKVEGGMMKFVLHFTKGTPFQFWSNVTKPLCISSMEYNRQHKILLDLIRKKDEEIAEYKAEGAELIRKNIETAPFNNDQLQAGILDANIGDHLSTFKTIISFYNKLNLHRLCIKEEKKTSPNNILDYVSEHENDEDKRTVAVNENTKSKFCTSAITAKKGDSESEEDNIIRMSKRKKSQCKMRNNITTICKPNKKLKKSLNDFIL
ncbi:hypothetical protein KM043_013223 [Ampulex compressa]|nr:hypothetical protein KM043_013223 [Ampulex compressa]